MQLLLTILLLLPLTVFATMNADELLTATDQYRSPYRYAKLELRIDEYKQGLITKSQHYTVYHQEGESLVSVVDGANKGNRILLSHKGMFIATKNSSRAIRITPIQRLLGQASYGDLAGLHFSKNYTPSILKQTENTFILELIAKKSSATYHKIILSIDKKNQQPIDAMAYLISGKLYKKMHYEIADNLIKNITYTTKNKHKKTVMNFLTVQNKKIPKRLLSSRGMRNTIR